MFWGLAATGAYGFAAAKYVTHRVKKPELDKLILKLHVAAGALLPVAAGIHTVLMFKKKPSPGQILTGLMADAGIVGLMYSHFFSKKLGKKAMPIHRFSTVFTGAGIAAHCIKNATK